MGFHECKFFEKRYDLPGISGLQTASTLSLQINVSLSNLSYDSFWWSKNWFKLFFSVKFRPGKICVSVKQKIFLWSILFWIEMSTPCLFSNLVFKRAIFNKLSKMQEVVKVVNCLSFCVLWYPWWLLCLPL